MSNNLTVKVSNFFLVIDKKKYYNEKTKNVSISSSMRKRKNFQILFVETRFHIYAS